jgi:hypothetical protein
MAEGIAGIHIALVVNTGDYPRLDTNAMKVLARVGNRYAITSVSAVVRVAWADGFGWRALRS